MQNSHIQNVIEKRAQHYLKRQKERERHNEFKKSELIATLKEIKKSESHLPNTGTVRLFDSFTKERERIEKLKKTLKEPNEKNKDLYKIVEDMIADKEEKLNVKINEANNKLKELSGLDNDEIESVINDVMIIIKDKINNKTEELELKEKIIQFLNPAQTGDLINLID